MIIKPIFLAIIATTIMVLTACNGVSEKTAAQNPTDKIDALSSSDNASVTEQQVFSELLAYYHELTSALAKDDDKEAAKAANGMLLALPKIKSESFSSAEKPIYEDIVADIKEHTEHITDNVGNISHQREHLVTLSKDFYDIVKTFGTEKPLYKVFCSMYNGNKGAYWLSTSKVVKNPYYGDAMLTCGVAQEELN